MGDKMYKNMGRFNDPKGAAYEKRFDELQPDPAQERRRAQGGLPRAQRALHAAPADAAARVPARRVLRVQRQALAELPDLGQALPAAAGARRSHGHAHLVGARSPRRVRERHMLKHRPQLQHLLKRVGWYFATFLVAVTIIFLPRLGDANPSTSMAKAGQPRQQGRAREGRGLPQGVRSGRARRQRQHRARRRRQAGARLARLAR